ncbi:hypothetical protein ACFOUP_17575 [Belliella kenyensis]|uniref:Uncharacterized protein n=1 Tax=Belliella kenyensis TaxID=1472724 RepID=A0ABV8ESA1_9BACT|nr:hypothetical protein [Belliella kenyensis]MCH7402520.1 hypothetical protein [Belliella kenyensis]MDN3603318.1 hypothetical protein [Belliella kenyensis]
MKQSDQKYSLIRQRITLVMVLFFCMLVSGMEYFPSDVRDDQTKTESSKESKESNPNQTFLDVAVDAVVPFVTTIAQSTFYVIYEILDFERISTFNSNLSIVSNLTFREVLFERIISTNAP